MISRVTADEVVRQADSGRTRPVIVLCEADSDQPLEVFCKLSAGCFEGVVSLAREVVAACLAVDLNLPVPTPYLVEIPSGLASAVKDSDIASRLQNSSPVGFGSKSAEKQFGVWTTGTRITDAMLPAALGALVFDAVIDNADRRLSNPNCLVSGNDLRLIDHELAFPRTVGLIGWQPPWQAGALRRLGEVDGHIFASGLKRHRLDFAPLGALWSAISDDHLSEYRAAIPPEWSEALPAVDEALGRVRDARDNLDGVIAEVERVLQ